MASKEAEVHIEAHRRLRVITSTVIEQAWRELGSWDEPDVPRFLDLAVPIVLAAQRGAVSLTEGFIAQVLGRRPLGVDPTSLIGSAVRNGSVPEEVYRRPFVTLWTDLGEGKQFSDALNAGLARAKSTAATDVQLSMRATANAVQEADEGIFGYMRIANSGACTFCQEVDGAYIKSADAMPLHPECGCGIEVLTAPHPRAARLPSGVAVHQHGELGSYLASPDHTFTGPQDL